MSKSKVYYIKTISPENVVKAFDALKKELPGKVAVKFHSGEEGNKYFLGPDFFKPIVKRVNGTLVECNTAYSGSRNTTKKHLKLLEKHGWTKNFKVDLMDGEPEDLQIPISNGKQIKNNYLGKNIKNYNSLLVVSHFKGHPEGGFGGAIKQLSIGCASTKGKCNIHSGGKYFDQHSIWSDMAPDEVFQDSMGDAAYSVCKLFGTNMAFINVMKDLTTDCDCVSDPVAPVLPDMGIFASLDPVAIDQACYDKIFNCNEKGKEEWLSQADGLQGLRGLETSCSHGIGKREYEIIEIK